MSGRYSLRAIIGRRLQSEKEEKVEDVISPTTKSIQKFVASLEGDDTSDELDIPPADQDAEEEDKGSVPTLEELFEDGLKDAAKDVTYEQSLRNLKLSKNRRTLPSMTIPLMPHQVTGIDWLQRQERRSFLQGGILADETGLGKTVQLVAVILESIRHAKAADPSASPKPTLVVVPTRSLVDQWQNKILRMATDDKLLTHCYRGKERFQNARHFGLMNVVITTYDMVLSDAKWHLKEDQFVVDDDYESEAEEKDEDGPGPLMQIEWHRVILDEAAFIRNMLGRRSQAIHLLKSDIRWCLTATPIHNYLLDIFPYLKFDGAVFWDDFLKQILSVMSKDRDTAMRRAQALLRQCSLRRTKESTINGKKILQLPPLDFATITLKLSPAARKIYDWISDDCEKELQHLDDIGAVQGRGLVAIIRLLKLRQACCHHRLALADRDWLQTLVSIDGDEDSLEELGESMEAEGGEEEVLTRVFKLRNVHPHAYRSGSTTTRRGLSGTQKGKKARSKKRKAKHLEEGSAAPDRSSDRSIFPEMPALNAEAECSAKITQIYELLQEWKGHKTLVFCTFVEMLHFTALYLKQKGINCVEYHGRCSQIARDRNLRMFNSAKPGSPTVMLLTHRSGGEGLNLTIATRIVLTTPSWAHAEVMQTIGRAHRIGQAQTVIVRELVFEDTVEEMVKERQAMKKQTAEGALGDDTSLRLGSMSYQELLQLFHRRPKATTIPLAP